MYLYATGSFNLREKEALCDLKESFKAQTGKVLRRVDRYSYLALLGAMDTMKDHEAKGGLYLCSGQGDMAVFERVCEQRLLHHQLPKPIDFINMLSNVSSYYLASTLGFSGKNIFVSNQQFPVSSLLMLVQNDLKAGVVPCALLGGVDEMISDTPLLRDILHVDQDMRLGEGSNWLYTGVKREGAIGSIEVYAESYTLEQLLVLCETFEEASVSFSMRFTQQEKETVLERNSLLEHYNYENICDYYETNALFVFYSFVKEKQETLFHIEKSGNLFKVIELRML